MKIGSTFNHEVYGPLKVTKKRYSRMGNKSLWIGVDEDGEEHELDGTEKPAKMEKESPKFLKDAAEVLGMAQGPKGEDADEDFIIEAVIPRVLEQIRQPENGKDGADADVELIIREMLPLVMEKMPRPKELNEALIIQRVVSRIRIPQDGKPGEKGKDGSPDTPVQVKEKLETLKGDERLDASAIKNLPKPTVQFGGDSYTGLAKIDSAGTPGTLQDKLVAGTNVTITKVNDTLRIASSGGVGGGQVDSIVAGNNIDVDATDPANPIVSVETLTLADISDITASATELNYTDGVTSAVQTQLNGKVSDTGDTMTGNLAITIPNSGNALGLTVTQNDTTNNPKGISVTNAGTGNAVYIDANGNTGTTASSSGALFLDNTGNTGTGANFYTNGATVGSTGVLFAKVDNASASGPVARFDNDGTGATLSVVNASTGNGLKVADSGAKGSSDSTSGAVLLNMSHATAVGMVLNIKTLNTGTTHNLVRANSASAYTTTVTGAQTISTSSTQLTVTSTSGFPTSGTIRVTNSTGATENSRSVMIHYTSVDATHFIGSAGVLYIESTSINLIDLAIVEYLESSQTASIIESIDTSTNGGMVNMKLTGVNPDIEFISKSGYDGSVGEGKYEIDIPTGDNVTRYGTDVMRFNGRSDSNSGYNPAFILTRPGAARQGMVGIGFQNLLSPVTMAAHLHIKNDTNFGDTNAAALVGMIVQGAASQTANLTDWKDNGGTILASITASGTLELGHASDTTLSRSAAGVLAVEGVRVQTTSPLVLSATSYTTDTGTSLNMDNLDMFIVTAQAGALLFNAPGGTLVQGRKLMIRIKDNGTARALTWNAVFRAMGTALPSTTVLSKTLYLGFVYNSTDTKWDLIASAQEV